MAIIVQDSFNRADSTTGLGVADTGQSWQVLSGNWGISANQALCLSGSTSLTVINSGISDVQVTVKSTVNEVTNILGSLAFRVTDNNNYWLLRYFNEAMQLYKFVGGSATLVASQQPIRLPAGSYEFKVIAKGEVIECYLDDVLYLSVTDVHNHSATMHGLRQHIIAPVRHDDFTVKSLVTEGTEITEIYATQQSVYKDIQVQSSTRQVVYNDVKRDSDLKQAICKQFKADYDTLQEIYNTSVIRIENYAMQIIINKDVSADYATRQMIHEAVAVSAGLKQVISRLDVLKVETRQMLTKEINEQTRMLQQVYTTRAADYDTLIKLRDDILSLIGTINLMAKRELYISLKAKQELIIHLKGGLNMTMKNQDFSMYAGDSKYVKFAVEGVSDLVGASMTWGIRRSKYSDETLLKKTAGDGISFVGAEAQITLNPTDTAALAAGPYYHECVLTDSIGNISTIFVGVITINKAATK